MLTAMAASLAAQAASFDCSKAGTKVEKLVCADAEVSRLDDELARAYRGALAGSAGKDAVREWQKSWLASTGDTCDNAACLKKAYTIQIGELDEHAGSAQAAIAASGRYQRYVRGARDRDAATLLVLKLQGDRVRVIGNALWVGNAATGNVNTGEFNGLARISGNSIRVEDAGNEECRLLITLGKGNLVVSGDKSNCGGLDVSFNGEYRRIGNAK